MQGYPPMPMPNFYPQPVQWTPMPVRPMPQMAPDFAPAYGGPMMNQPMAYRNPQWVKRPMPRYLPPPPVVAYAPRYNSRPYYPVTNRQVARYSQPAAAGYRSAPRSHGPMHIFGSRPPQRMAAPVRILQPRYAVNQPPRWQRQVRAPQQPRFTNGWRQMPVGFAPQVQRLDYRPQLVPVRFRPTSYAPIQPSRVDNQWRRSMLNSASRMQRPNYRPQLPLAAGYRPVAYATPRNRSDRSVKGYRPSASANRPVWSRLPARFVTAPQTQPRQFQGWGRQAVRNFPQHYRPMDRPVASTQWRGYRPLAQQVSANRYPVQTVAANGAFRMPRRVPTIARWGDGPYRSW